MKKVIFLAGPYREYNKDGSLDRFGIQINLERMKSVVKILLKKGYAVICPNLTYAFLEGENADYSDIIEGTKELLRRSDIVCFMPGWEKSEGCKKEMDFALSLEKLIMNYDEV